MYYGYVSDIDAVSIDGRGARGTDCADRRGISGGVAGVVPGAFYDQANSSLIERDGQTVGSSMIGQSFVDPETGFTLPGYFRGRPSAAGEGYDASLSSGSNLGPLNPVLAERIASEVAIDSRREMNWKQYVLTLFPVLALGPIFEHLVMIGGG